VYILCAFVSYCMWGEGGPDGIRRTLEPIFLQCFDIVGWVV